MSKPITPEVIAEITLLPTVGGGRAGPILQGEFRGVFGVDEEEHFSVRVRIPHAEGLSPGQTGEFGIQFLVPDVALPHFPVGKRFTIWEGRAVGTGRILEVLDHA